MTKNILFICIFLQFTLAQAQVLCVPELEQGTQAHLLSSDLQSISQSLNRSGGWSGNGGDFGEINDNIWYLGSEEIKYCIQSSKSFPVTNPELQEMIEKSIGKWKNFYEKYDLINPLDSLGALDRRNKKISFLDEKSRSINFNFKLAKDCTDTKLKFFFGQENKVISDYKKYATEHPYGFALRKSYDHKNYINDGLIWLKEVPNIEIINHTLLHELGHIFGMKHDSVYIMRSTIAQDMEANSFKSSVDEIESKQWPYRFSKNSTVSLTLPSKRRRNSLSHCQNEEDFKAGKNATTLNHFLQTKKSDCISIKLTSTSNTSSMQNTFNLIFKNNSTNKQLNIHGIFSKKRRRFKKKIGPGVFSKFLISNQKKEKIIWTKLYLDKKESNELSGSFNNQGVIIPAKLIQEKGAILDLYLTKVNKWLTLRSYNK